MSDVIGTLLEISISSQIRDHIQRVRRDRITKPAYFHSRLLASLWHELLKWTSSAKRDQLLANDPILARRIHLLQIVQNHSKNTSNCSQFIIWSSSTRLVPISKRMNRQKTKKSVNFDVLPSLYGFPCFGIRVIDNHIDDAPKRICGCVNTFSISQIYLADCLTSTLLFEIRCPPPFGTIRTYKEWLILVLLLIK